VNQFAIAEGTVKAAKARWGGGWNYLSQEPREGAVALQIVALLRAHPWDVAPPNVRELQAVVEMAFANLALFPDAPPRE
jgi:hypothetical protein